MATGVIRRMYFLTVMGGTLTDHGKEFVAMPLGQGYTVEGQVIGKEVGNTFSGIVFATLFGDLSRMSAAFKLMFSRLIPCLFHSPRTGNASASSRCHVSWG